MIDALRSVVEQAERLPEPEQERLAEEWLRTLENLAWERALSAPGSVEMLTQWRDRVRAEYAAGETEEIQGDDWDE